VVIAACEQCGRNHIPEVAAIIGFDGFLGQAVTDGYGCFWRRMRIEA